ncbi:MAG: hypothetical protein ABSD97_00370 [Acidimicrobiales bacterium]|jgi:hypothetical protein
MSATTASAAIAIVRAGVAARPVNAALRIALTRVLLAFASGARKTCSSAVVIGFAPLRSILVVAALNGAMISRKVAASRFVVAVRATVVVGAIVVGALVGVVVLGGLVVPPHAAHSSEATPSAAATLMISFMTCLQCWWVL